MANNPGPVTDAEAMRPLFLLIAIVFVGLFAFAGWVVLDASTYRNNPSLALNAALSAAPCPPPRPGEALVVIVPAPNAQGDAIATCSTFESQGAARAKLAAKAVQ